MFLNTSIWERFPLIKKMLYSPPQPMWDPTIHPLREPSGLAAHRSVSSSNTICNNQGTKHEALFIKVWKPLTCFKNLEGKPERKNPKRAISASGGLGHGLVTLIVLMVLKKGRKLTFTQ